MSKSRVVVALVASAVCVMSADRRPATTGREIFEKRCTGCHALDHTKAGPPLGKVFGRSAAADPAFPYSKGLRTASLVWDEATLDRWLADPESVVPDTDMAFRLARPEERAAIIKYLRELVSEKTPSAGNR